MQSPTNYIDENQEGDFDMVSYASLPDNSWISSVDLPSRVFAFYCGSRNEKHMLSIF